MNDQPLVSVIVPTYNRAHFLDETLNSIANQTYKNLECIIVDDGSDDNTEDLIMNFGKKDQRFKYYKRPGSRLKGANACRNYGFELSHGEYINWFDDDDIMDPEKLELQILGLQKSDYEFSVCQTKLFKDSKDHTLGLRHNKIISSNTIYDYITHGIAFLTQAPIFKRSFLQSNNLKFDEALQAAQEWELIIRALYYAPKYHIINKPLVLMRKHDNSISHGMPYEERMWQYFKARRKIYYWLRNKDYKSKKEIEKYLVNYIKDYFGKVLFSGKKNRLLSICKQDILPLYGNIKKTQIVLFVMFVMLTSKGYAWRKRILN